MPKFVEAARGYINLDRVAYVFRKESGDYVAYSDEGNEIGTISGQIADLHIVGSTPDSSLAARGGAALRKIQSK
jgi:hypothetical protein